MSSAKQLSAHEKILLRSGLLALLLALCFAVTACSGVPADMSDGDGEATPADGSQESEAQGEGSETDGQFVPGKLPVVYIHIEGGAEEVRKMIESEDHSYRCTGTMDLSVPDGYESAVAAAISESVSGLEIEYIRGRGNSTWGADKKPFKIKLDKKADFFGMGKSKHWVLLANSSDKTLLRNGITLWLAEELGMPYTPQFVFVDVVMEGEYLGSYYLAEQVRLEKGRTDLPELEEGMTGEPDIWGGYLLALHPYPEDPEEDKFITAHEVDFLHESPSFALEDGDYQNDAQRDYIRGYVQKVEDAIFAGDFAAVSALLDVTSAADYWWMQELSENLDAYRTSSTYLYKEKTEADGSEGKLYFGPVWDFDYAWGNVLNGTPNPEGLQHAEMPWTKELFQMPEFAALVKARWSKIDALLEEMVAPGGILDRYAGEIRGSWEQEHRLTGRDSSQSAEAVVFDDEIEALRTFIDARRSWINDHLDMLDHLYSTVTLHIPGAPDQTLAVYTGSTLSIEYTCTAPEIEGQYFIGWYTESGEKAEEYLQITGDTALDARYIPESEVTWIEDLAFESAEVQVSMSDGTYWPVYTVSPDDAIDKSIHWSVSDDEHAMVDGEGCVILMAPGDVTLTATLHSGKTVSCLIHIAKAED
ncbi:MAG: CotH kinase family protein [Eggerthellaceae bacterium]|nr:CotH kinase family protein [Eggerthellaceae bacterium]